MQTHTHGNTHTHTHTHTHTRTHTDADKDSNEYSIVAFCKNATIIIISMLSRLSDIENVEEASMFGVCVNHCFM